MGLLGKSKGFLTQIGRLERRTAYLTIALLLLLLPFILFPLRRDTLYPAPALRITDRHGELLRVYLSPDDRYLFPCRLEEVSPYMIQSVITFEDRWFYYHPGVNPVSIIRAMVSNIRAGHVVSGGSTITQQVARMIEGRPRTLSAKLIEAFRAFQLELLFTKNEILEIYFNLAPYGGNIHGITSAGLLYYGKSPSALGPGEAALLSALPNSPTQLRPDLNHNAAGKRRNDLLQRLLGAGVITESRFDEAITEDIPVARQTLPVIAPHLSDELYRRSKLDSRIIPPDGKIRSTIDLQIQQKCTALLKRHIDPFRPLGVQNGAVVVIDNETNGVRALVGSVDYQEESEGQVNGATSVRSPGSTLKPFIYALGLAQGKISPTSLLYDVPRDYKGYIPQNFDQTYHGMVTMEQSLIRSMNVPAVNLTAELGVSPLYHLLRKGGCTTLTQPPDWYGLSLILGGGGVRLLELTNLYAMLANQGVYRPYRIVEDQPVAEGERLLSAESVYLITDVLSQLVRPDFPSKWEYSINLPKVAWKTGTSYGYRDAWSIGYTPRYTVGVWLGNFDNSGSSALVGADAAGPLFFDIISLLGGSTGEWFTVPDGIGLREVCAFSGKPANRDCPVTKWGKYIENVSPATLCDMHVLHSIDDSTGFRLCPHCRTGKSYSEKLFVQYPAEVTEWMAKARYPIDRVPRHNPLCLTATATGTIEITSPSVELTYFLRERIPMQDQKIRCQAIFSSSVRTIYWFVDDELLYSGTPDQPVFYTPTRGRHTVVVMDEDGKRGETVCVVE